MVLVFFAGCSEDNITNVADTGGVIFGRVIPAAAGIEVAAWQARLIGKTDTDSLGYFTLAGLKAGLYEIRISRPSGIVQVVKDVEVPLAGSKSLGEIQLNLQWPITNYSPRDGAKGISPTSPVISINSEVALDLNSLNTYAVWNPTLSGEWQPNYGYSSYEFTPSVQLKTSTNYRLTLNPGVKLASGEEWGQTLTFAFTTDNMRVLTVNWSAYGPANHVVYPGYTGALFSVTFSTYLDESSIDAGVKVEPEFEFTTDMYSEPSSTVTIGCGGGLKSGTTYRIFLTRQLKDILGDSLSSTDTLTFSTERFRVTDRNYPNSRTDIPPSTSTPLLDYHYNLAVDKSSATSAVTIEPAAAIRVQIQEYSNELTVSAPNGLLPGTSYTITISADLTSIDGSKIGETDSVVLTTQALKVTSFSPRGDSYPSDGDTLIDPGSNSFNPRISFNADIDPDSFNIAASFFPDIEGFWYLVTQSYSTPYLAFFPTSEVALLPEQLYGLRLKGDVGIGMGIGLVRDTTIYFRTRPVMITNLYPSPGSRSVNQYQYVSVQFNTEMDTASTRAAFQMTTYAGIPVTGSIRWDSELQMQFDPGRLQTGETYQVYVDTTARSKSGANLKERGHTFFKVGD